MIHRHRDELVEARADLALADERAAAAYADYFDAQMRTGKTREHLSPRPVLRRAGKVLLAILVFLFGGLHGEGDARGLCRDTTDRSGQFILSFPAVFGEAPLICR